MRAAIILLALFAPAATAQEAAPAVAASSLFTGDYLLQVIGSFVLVIVLLFGALLFLRRFNGVGRSLGGKMQVISSIGLGQRERAVLLQVGEQQILVGVAAGNVRTLHVFDEVCELEAQELKAPTFSEVWKVATGQRGEKA
jgi:flagellar protein FliO/FliZ